MGILSSSNLPADGAYPSKKSCSTLDMSSFPVYNYGRLSLRSLYNPGDLYSDPFPEGQDTLLSNPSGKRETVSLLSDYLWVSYLHYEIKSRGNPSLYPISFDGSRGSLQVDGKLENVLGEVCDLMSCLCSFVVSSYSDFCGFQVS